MEEYLATFADANKKAEEALRMAACAEVKALSRQIILQYPEWCAFMNKEIVKNNVGKIELFFKAMQEAGFTVEDKPCFSGMVKIGITSAVKASVDEGNVATLNNEPAIEPAIYAYKNAKEAHESNLKSQEAKAIAFILSLTEPVCMISETKLADHFGKNDLEGVHGCLSEHGVKISTHGNGYAYTPTARQYTYLVDDLGGIQKEIYKLLWPSSDSNNEQPDEGSNTENADH